MTASEKKEFLAQYEEIHESLMRFCIVKSRGIMDPKDLANDVLLVGLENYQKLENKKALLSYLFTTANRICLNKARRKNFDGKYDQSMAENMKDPQNNVDSRVDITLLYVALDQLPPLQKEAVTLFEISDLPIKEIMVIQNSGASAVKQRIKRGREKLVELMREKDHKKTAVVASVLFTTNSFSMSNLDTYFQAIKELPLPLTGNEAAATVNSFQLAGSATNATAAKLGSVVIKKALFGTVIIGTVVGTTVLLSNTSEAAPDAEPLTEMTSIDVQGNEEKVTPDHSETTISYTEVIEDYPAASNLNQEELDQVIQHLLIEPSDSIKKVNITDYIAEIAPEEEIIIPAAPTYTADELLTGDLFPMAGVSVVALNHLGDNVEFKTWDRDEIKIIPNHKIEGKTPEDEALIRKNIDFKVEKKADILTISNHFCSVKKEKKRSGKNSISTITFGDGSKAKYKVLELNYEIMLPASANLQLKGNYENLIIPDMGGDLVGNLIEGNLKVGDIAGKTDLKLRYLDAELGDFTDATLYFFDSDVTLGSTDKLDLNAKYSKVRANEINGVEIVLFDSKMTIASLKNDLNGTLKYSNLTLTESAVKKSNLTLFESHLNATSIEELDINLRYSKLTCSEIETLSMSVTFESKINITEVGSIAGASSKYSTYKIGSLKSDIELQSFEDDLTISKTTLASMEFKGKYSTYNITLAKPADYRFNFEGKYGNLDYSNLDLTIEDYETINSLKVIKGYFQSGVNSNANIQFDCFESQVNLN